MVALFVVVVLALGGGVSFAAESSVPGDALYFVKTSVNEEVRGALAMGAEADAKWEAELAVRRLDEAAKLESRGSLTAEAAADLDAEVNSHAEAAIDAVENSDASADAKAKIEAEIRAHISAALDAQAAVVAPRDVATGQASGKRTFTMPHVLEVQLNHEVKSPRDSASGQATGKINVNSGDVNGDGSAETTTGTSVDTDDDGAADTKAGASGSIELKAGYDVKANTRP